MRQNNTHNKFRRTDNENIRIHTYTHITVRLLSNEDKQVNNIKSVLLMRNIYDTLFTVYCSVLFMFALFFCYSRRISHSLSLSVSLSSRITNEPTHQRRLHDKLRDYKHFCLSALCHFHQKNSCLTCRKLTNKKSAEINIVYSLIEMMSFSGIHSVE